MGLDKANELDSSSGPTQIQPSLENFTVGKVTDYNATSPQALAPKLASERTNNLSGGDMRAGIDELHFANLINSQKSIAQNETSRVDTAHL